MTSPADTLIARSLQYKTERDDLLLACKALLCLHYGHFGPRGEGDLASFAERLVEKADGRRFDPRSWILENARQLRDGNS